MSKRSLKNLLISYMGALNTPEAAEFAHGRFNTAANMTDAMACLATLSHMDSPHRTEALDRFYQQWKSDPLVMDKWFSVQAASMRTDTVEQVKRLADHPDYSLKNPNRVRSLAGVFAFQNPAGFHSQDGRGYTFLADQIIALDKSNPQISARLVSGFNRWKRFDQKRQLLMKQELKRIITIQEPSRDVYEIVSKALE